MPVLSFRSTGPRVAQLRQLLNQNIRPSPNLPAGDTFDSAVLRAVQAYQRINWLVPDGIVGPCTWNALTDNEDFMVYRPPTELIPQPTNDTCWAASTAMLTGLTVDQVITEARGAGVAITNGLANDSENQTFTNTALFARTFDLTLVYPQSWLPIGLAHLMQAHGTLMVDTLWDPGEYTAGRGSSGHMRIIAGLRGDNTGEGSTMLLYDPWSPNIGKVQSVIYGPFMRRYPTSTYQLFYV